MTEASSSLSPAPIPFDGADPLVVPVLSQAGGVGRSTLQYRTADRDRRVVAVCDTSPRSASPWPGWVDHTAARGTGWLARCAADAELFAREIKRSASAFDIGEGAPVWVLTDTGELQPSFSGVDPGPRFWTPLLPYLRAAVIDADALEGFRLVRQRAGGEPSVAAAWLSTPETRTAAVWVTDPSPYALARTVEAIAVAEECGLPARRFVVVINDSSGHRWTSRSRSRRTLLADRVGAIVEIGHDPALRRDDRPSYSPRQLDRRDIADLATAVVAAAR
jgi:hypothetical protein